jgi:hypothetical protein
MPKLNDITYPGPKAKTEIVRRSERIFIPFMRLVSIDAEDISQTDETEAVAFLTTQFPNFTSLALRGPYILRGRISDARLVKWYNPFASVDPHAGDLFELGAI